MRANSVFIIGSSMRDRAIANGISDALQAGKKTAVIVDPKAETIRTKLSQKARGRAHPLEGRFIDEWGGNDRSRLEGPLLDGTRIREWAGRLVH